MAGEELFKKLKRRSTLLACFGVVVASLGLAGWLFDVEFLKYPIRGAASPNPLTAIDFILLSAALIFLTSGHPSKNKLLVGSILALIPTGSGLYTLLDLLFHFPIHVDQILFKEKLSLDALSNMPSRMAPNTAMNFVLSGVSLLMMSWAPAKAVRYQVVNLIVAFIATFALLGYLYQVPEFFGALPFFPMAPATAICFFLFAMALLFAKSNDGLMRELTSQYAGSLVARFLIPTAIVLPVLIGYFRLWGHWQKIFSTEMGVAIIVLSFIICFAAAVWLVVVNKRDTLMKQTDSELSRLNDQLKAANLDLAVLNEEFVASNEELVSSNEELTIINEQLETANQTIAKQKDEQLNRVLDSSNDVIWSFDLTGNGENYLSRSAERIYGEPLDVLIHRPQFWLEHLHPEDQAIKEASQRRLEVQGFTESTYRVSLQGGTRWIHDSLRLIRDKNRKPQRLEGIATDVTSIEEAQRELDKERHLLRSLIDNIPDYIFVKDDHFRHIMNNKANVEQLGATNEMETLGKTAEDYHGEAGAQFTKDDQLVFSSGQPIINKEETLKAGNGTITVLTTKIPLKDEKGKVTALIGISRDITELKKQERVLNQYRENLAIVFNNSTDTFLLLDEKANVILFNKAFENFLFETEGIKVQSGMRFMDVVAPHRKQIAQSFFERALAKENVTVEAELTSRLGKKINLLVRYEPAFHDGKVTHVSISAVNITDRKEKENLLKESEANLESILRATLDGFVLLNRDYEVLMTNDSYRKIAKNVSGNDVKIGLTFFDIVPSERHAVFKTMLDKVKAQEIVHYEVDYENGSVKGWFNVTITPVLTDHDEFLGYCVSAHDITAQKLAEISIRASEERFRALVENSEDISIISDFDGKVLFASANLPRVLGFENLASGYGALIHPEDKALSASRISFLRENPGKSYPLTFRIKHNDGSWRWMEGTSTNLSQVESIKGIVSTYRDVTERKTIEDQLKQNQFFLEKASEAAKIGYWTSEPDAVNGNLTWSKEVFKIFQVDQKDFDGKYETFFHFVHPDDRDRVKGMARLAAAGDHIYDIDHRIVLKNGEIRWVNERAQVVKNKKNEVVRIVGVVQDITERKRIEEMLREYNSRYEILSQATNDVIWDWDILRDTVLYNHGMQTVLGYSELEIKSTGAWWDERIHPEDRDRILNEIKEVFEEQLRTWDSVYRYRTAGGDYKYIHDRAYVVYSNTVQPIRMIGAMQDVTELIEYRFGLEKKVEERTLELNLALQKEKELVEMKNKFVSIASHEFRTPLSTISFAAESIRNYFHQLTAVEINRKLIKIEDQASHMTNLLDDILTLGRSDAGKMKVKRISLDLKEFIDSLIEEVRATVREKREINFIFSCISSKVNADDKLLRNVVNNLLTNALKFSAADTTVTIAVSDFHGDILIGVTDEGIGIEESELTSVFESFQRGSNASAVQGTGLGLSILKKAVELMDGSVEVKSKVNTGSTFRVQIPIR